MYYEPYIYKIIFRVEQKFYIESLVMSRAQITQLLLGRSSCIIILY